MKPWAFVAAATLVLVALRRRRHLEPPLLIGLVLGAAGLAVYGTGWVEPPNLEELLLDIGETLGAWTYLLVGVMAFLETGAFVGLIAPGETAMIVGGVVAGQGQISVITLIGIAWTAAVLGDVASYELGRRLGRDFLVRHGPRFQITAERLALVEAFFAKHGGKAIFVGRFVGIVRAVAPFLAGSGGMRFRRFLPYDVLGAGLWATTFILLGYVFWQSLDRLLTVAKQGALGLGIAISLVVGLIWAVRYLRVPEHRAQLEEQVDRALDRPVLRLLRPVVRWARGPARFFLARLTPGQLGLELTTLLAIGAVGSFAYLGYWIQLEDQGSGALDVRVNGWAVDLEHPTATQVAEVVTLLGAPWLMETLCALAALALLARRRILEAVVVGLGMALTVAAVQLAKQLVDRPRPDNALVDAAGASYPSGHAAYAMAWIVLAIVGVRVVPWLRGRWWLVIVAIVVAALVGVTRIYLRVHYLADVLGGEGAAAMCFSAVAIVALVVAFVRHNGARA
jgi:undecaprenyl-diphosphatase